MVNVGKATDLLKRAKYEFEHNAFGPLKQAEFFAAMEAALNEPETLPPINETDPPPAKGAKK